MALLDHNRAPTLADQKVSAHPLLLLSGLALMILRLLFLLPDNSQGFFEESGGEFTVRSLEAHRVNLDLSLSGDDDFDGAFPVHVHGFRLLG